MAFIFVFHQTHDDRISGGISSGSRSRGRSPAFPKHIVLSYLSVKTSQALASCCWASWGWWGRGEKSKQERENLRNPNVKWDGLIYLSLLFTCSQWRLSLTLSHRKSCKRNRWPDFRSQDHPMCVGIWKMPLPSSWNPLQTSSSYLFLSMPHAPRSFP